MLPRAAVVNHAVAGELEPILEDDLTPVLPASTFRLGVIIGNDIFFGLIITPPDGGTPFTGVLNNATPLAAGFLYSFEVPVRQGFSYNFITSAATTVAMLLVDEVDAY